MQDMARNGATVLGGCCGTTPEHIHKTKLACDDIPVCEITDKNRTVISSYSHAVTFGGRPILIGERINPTGKPKFKQALKDKDLTYILSMGVAQQESRADVLDVNVGLPGIDEPQMMVDVVKELQGVLDLPLQIDTSDPVAMERALRIYNGKPLINSVNGKKEVMEQIFPLVKHMAVWWLLWLSMRTEFRRRRTDDLLLRERSTRQRHPTGSRKRIFSWTVSAWR